jgi:hypothetical protein
MVSVAPGMDGIYRTMSIPDGKNLPIDVSSVHSRMINRQFSYPPPAAPHHHCIDTATVAAQVTHYHMLPLLVVTAMMYYPQPHTVTSAGQSVTTIHAFYCLIIPLL